MCGREGRSVIQFIEYLNTLQKQDFGVYLSNCFQFNIEVEIPEKGRS